MGPDLTTALTAWEHAWAAAGAPTNLLLRPPADESTIRTKLANFPSTHLDTLINWFGWHDGPTSRDRSWHAVPVMGSLLALDDALHLHQLMLDVPSDDKWNRHHLPLFHSVGGDVRALDTDTGQMFNIGKDDWPEGFLMAPTLLECATLWADKAATLDFRWEVTSFADPPGEWGRGWISMC